MESLISNTSFGGYLKSKNISDLDYRKLRDNYDSFLTQSLELYQFVPCDEEGNVLQEKKPFQDNYHKWEQARERCLFEGFEFIDFQDGFVYCKNKDLTIIFDTESDDVQVSNNYEDAYVSAVEDLIKYNLQLTPTALK